jgi:hypothetical protein
VRRVVSFVCLPHTEYLNDASAAPSDHTAPCPAEQACCHRALLDSALVSLTGMCCVQHRRVLMACLDIYKTGGTSFSPPLPNSASTVVPPLPMRLLSAEQQLWEDWLTSPHAPEPTAAALKPPLATAQSVPPPGPSQSPRRDAVHQHGLPTDMSRRCVCEYTIV